MMHFPSLDVHAWTWDSSLPGSAGAFDGSDLNLIISTTDSYQDLFKTIDEVMKKANEQNLFKSVSHNLNLNNLSYNVELDKNILNSLSLRQEQVAKMIEIFFSGNSSLEFKKDGILYPITIKGDINPWTLDELYLSNIKGERISIGAFAKMIPKAEPAQLFHYNQMRAVKLSATLAENENLVSGMNKLYKFADEHLPKSYKKNWTGIAKTYNENSSTMLTLFILALLFIYAILAVQFENFIDPLIILFTVPLACCGALLTLYFTNGSLNIYSQVGLITLIGLITKHGILIVEFANQLNAQGLSLLESIEQASTRRLRPIMMTTAAMIFGAIPLIISSSAGSESRHAIGLVLVGGLSFGTIFTLFVLPTLYYVIKSLSKKR